MGYAMFPSCFRVIDILIIVTLAIGSALVTLIGAPLGHYDLNSNLLVLLPGNYSGIGSLLTSQRQTSMTEQGAQGTFLHLQACAMIADLSAGVTMTGCQIQVLMQLW